MSKDRNIDDAELANISGAGDKDIEGVGGGGGGFTVDDETKPPTGGGGGGGAPDGVEGDAQNGGDQEFGPA